MPKLIYQDPELGQEVVVEMGHDLPEVTIGRNPGNIIRINNPSISRRHSKFVYEGGRCTLYDLNSSNGTYINGTRIATQVLNHGDRVRVGEFPMDFVEGGVEPLLQSSKPRQSTHQGVGAYDQPDYDPASFANGIEQGTAASSKSGLVALEQDAQPLYGSQPYENPGLLLNDSDLHEVMDAEELYPDVELDSQSYELDHEEAGPGFNSQPFDEGGYDEHGDTANAPAEQIAASLAALHSQPDHEGSTREFGDPAAGPNPWAMGAGAAAAGNDLVELEAELAALRTRNEQLEQDNQDLSNLIEQQAGDPGGATGLQIERLRKERDRLADERRNLMRQIKEVKQELDDAPTAEDVEQLQAQLAQSQEHAAELDAQLQHSNATSADHEANLNALREQYEALGAEAEHLRSQFTETEQARLNVDSERSELGNQVSELQENLQGYEARYNEAQETIQELQADLDAAHERTTELQESLAQSEATVAELQSGLDEQIQNVSQRDARIDELTQIVDELTIERDQLRAHGEELQAELEARPVADDVARIHEDLQSTRANLDAVTAERDNLIAERDGLQEQVEGGRDLLNDIQKRYEKAGAERDDFKRERDFLKQEKVAYARETDYLQVERRKQADQISELTAKVEGFDKDNKRKKKIFAELSNDLRGLVEENNKLNERVKTLEGELEGAPSSDEVNALQERIEELTTSLEEAQVLVDELEGDSSRLTRDLGEIAQERDQLAERIAEMDEELATLREAADDQEAFETIEALQAAQAELNQKIEELEESIQTKDAELEELKQAAEAAQAAGDSLDEAQAGWATEREELEAQLEEAKKQAESTADLEEAEAKWGAERDALQAQLDEAQSQLEAAQAALEEAQDAGHDAGSDDAASSEPDSKLQETVDKLIEEKAALETTLAELILENDSLKDKLENG